jgi:hypothetical protein
MAVLLSIKKGKKISFGWNKCIFYSSKNPHEDYMNGKKITIHAEEMALKSVSPSKLKGATLYVVRNGHDMLNSKPCDRCQSIINSCMKKNGLKNVYYS